MTIRESQEAFERSHLAPAACASATSRGRAYPEAECTVRTAFERDLGRIIYALPFRRLRHKAQVFFSPQNDHICTRMEHVLYVAYIAETIGRALHLNVDLIRAIAFAHDIGHAPFGHAGERVLDRLAKACGLVEGFHHETHGVRVLTRLTSRTDKNGQVQPGGLNLSYEVIDGVLSHCGEAYDERIIVPDFDRTFDVSRPLCDAPATPGTLEGAAVRMADRIAFVGRDIEDASRAGLMTFSDIPKAVGDVIGVTNREIVNHLVEDVIAMSDSRSRETARIALSEARAAALTELINLSVRAIYKSQKIKRYEMMATSTIEGLVEALLPLAEARGEGATAKQADFVSFLARHPEPDATPLRVTIDYVAGMTDHYAKAVFDEFYHV